MTEINLDKIKVPNIDAMPPLTPEENARLESSLKQNGQLEPIELIKKGSFWHVGDGNNRLRILRKLKKTPLFRIIELPKGMTEFEYAVRVNMDRRQLSDSVKFEWAKKLYPKYMRKVGRPGAEQELKKFLTSSNDMKTTAEAVGELVGLSSDKIYKFRKIDLSAPYMIDEIKSGNTTLNKAWKKTCNEQKHKERHTNTPDLPAGEFDIIYGDPPWRYSSAQNGAAIHHYADMSVEEICALKVPAAKNAMLFLWTTGPMMFEAKQVIESWGFEYKTQMVWVKSGGTGVGYYVRGDHELLLIAKRGDMPIPADNCVSSVMEFPRGRHSEKPAVVRGIIQNMYPNRKYLELFARSKVKGWTVWGKEVN